MTYDRYLMKSFLHTFSVCFITMFGLVAVIDLFENLDEMFQLNGDNGPVQLLGLIATLNGYRSILFLDRAGPRARSHFGDDCFDSASAQRGTSSFACRGNSDVSNSQTGDFWRPSGSAES